MEKLIALTFDDGPNVKITPQVLDILEEYDAPGSFFLVGEQITEETIPVIKREIAMGCDIGNHSYTHGHMNEMPIAETLDELRRTEEKIKPLTGKDSIFFRPPFFDYNEEMLEKVDFCFITGQACEDWDESVTKEQRIEKIMSQACDGAIVLLHDLHYNDITVSMLGEVITLLRNDGYRLVTLTELFEKKGVDPKSAAARGKVYEVVA
ncbi:MAG: polysaccharide deacetylase family protein [Lachnospiraceae bacterium]|nr:polysaccharide deacetylase family protein [Lachnospiraceae bacterium]